MSWQSAILLGWTAMHGYFAVFCAGIWLARPKERHALVLLGLVANMAAFICAGVLRDHGGHVLEVSFFAHLRAVLAALQAALFVDFAARLSGPGGQANQAAHRSVVRLSYGVAGVTLLAAVSVGLYEPVPADPGLRFGWVPRPNTTRVVLAVMALPAPALMAVRMTRFGGHLPGGRAFAAALVVVMVCAMHDMAVRFLGLYPIHLFDHALVLVSAALTHILLLQSQEVSTRLRRQNRVLGEQTAALAQTRDEIREAAPLAAVGELAAMLAQEVEAPVRAIRNGARELEQRPDAGTWQRMDGAIATLDRLVENLLGQTRPVTPVRAWSLLSELVSDAVDGSRMPRGRDARIALSDTVRACEVFVDPALFHDALGALIDAVREGEGRAVLEGDRDRERGGVRLRVWAEGEAGSCRPLGLALPFAARVLGAHGGEAGAEAGGRGGARVWLPADACRSVTGDAA